jgi:hypothetical protein
MKCLGNKPQKTLMRIRLKRREGCSRSAVSRASEEIDSFLFSFVLSISFLFQAFLSLCHTPMPKHVESNIKLLALVKHVGCLLD